MAMKPAMVLAAAAASWVGPAALAIPPLTRRWTRAARPAGGMHVALTFDDGPHPDGTPAVLDVLADFGVTASFFVVGEQAQRHAGVVERVVADGHAVELHGYRHLLLARRAPSAVIDDIRRGYTTIRRVGAADPQWYRAPYGAATWPALFTAHHLGMTPVWWTSEGRDWRAAQHPAAITDRLLRRQHSGRPGLDHRDVLLLHDSDAYATAGSWRATVAALPGILSAMRSAGLRVGPLPRLTKSAHVT
jgi:peptidoglycan/xylan/chitin deacetylase (PgdA/CDA1 family)